MSNLKVNTISELTAGNGVAIDGATIKDGGATLTTGLVINPTAAALVLSINPVALEDDTRKWNFGVAAVVNTGNANRKDVIMAFGYNANAGGGRLDPTDHCLHFAVEDYYAPVGVDPVTEAYLQFVSSAGVTIRPWYANVNLSSNKAGIDFYDNQVSWYAPDPGGFLMMDLTSGANAAASEFTIAVPTVLNSASVTVNGPLAPAYPLSVKNADAGSASFQIKSNSYGGYINVTGGSNGNNLYLTPGSGQVSLYDGATAFNISVYNGATKTIQLLSNGLSYINTGGSLVIGSTTDGMTAGGSLAITKDLAHRGDKAGFFNTAPITKPTITGSRGGNAALASLLTQGAALGLWIDSTSA